MGRPRKLGPTISFRLPIELHEIAAERADANGETVNQYVARRFSDALERHTVKQATSDSKRQINSVWKASMKP
jgi:hypothetical protein